ncbi:MAG: SRPBCC domain-containing protein [Calothrix sp. MO_167.B12]|nr:SRPBCC domain-containing protein [Calothrix sp. MO_167.B12]
MLSTSNKAILEASTTSSTVVVNFATSASAIEVWQALTEPNIVGRWFGTLTSTLFPGETVRLEFGDGDFFMLEVTRSEPPHLLEYNWRFLGVGPLDTITWRILPQNIGCLVTVIDNEPERSPESALLLRQGWLDFTQRLERFLTTDIPTRYDWRREFDGSIELPCRVEVAWDKIFASQAQAQWLPLSCSILEAGAHLTLEDGLEPSLLQILNVIWNPPNRVQFQLTHSDWLHPTNCQLELSPRSKCAMLTIQHFGWEAISPHRDYQLQQRKRFSSFWITALQSAVSLLGTSKK